MKKILERVEIDSARLHLDRVSASEGSRFTGVVSCFTQKMKELGPISEIKDLKNRLSIAREIIEEMYTSNKNGNLNH